MSCEHEHVENYLNRIRNFQDNLILWLVTWNIALIGAYFFVLLNLPDCQKEAQKNFILLKLWIMLIDVFGLLILNLTAALLYERHRNQIGRILNNNLQLKEIDRNDPNKGFNWCVMSKFFILINMFNGCLIVYALLKLRDVNIDFLCLGLFAIVVITMIYLHMRSQIGRVRV